MLTLALYVACLVASVYPPATLVSDAYVALASEFQIAMLGLAGSVLILIASISRSDTMRLRTLLRGGNVEMALFEMLVWLVMLGLGRGWLRPQSVGMGLLLSAFVLAQMLIRVLSMLLNPSKYWNEYTNLLGSRFSSVVSRSARRKERYVEFRSWIDGLDAEMSSKYIPLVACELTQTYVLVASAASGPIEDINLSKLKRQLLGLKSDVVPGVREIAKVGQPDANSDVGEGLVIDDNASKTPPMDLPVVVFFEAPGHSVEIGDALLGMRKDRLHAGELSASEESGLRECFVIGDGTTEVESDVAIERGELRDRALQSLETGSINDAVIAEAAFRRLCREFLAVMTTCESTLASRAHEPERDYERESEWSELDDLIADIDAIVLSARRTPYDDVFERLEAMPYHFASLAERYRANRPFRRSCALIAKEAVEMGVSRKDQPTSTRNRRMAEAHVDRLSLLLYGVSSGLERATEWQAIWPWFVNEIDALLLDFCWILYQASEDAGFGRYLADKLVKTCSLLPGNATPSRPAPQSVFELRENVPTLQRDARLLIGRAIEDLRVAASLIAYGLATDDTLTTYPISPVSPSHMGLSSVGVRDFIRGYALAQGMAEHDSWNFGFWRRGGEPGDMRDPQALVAVGAVGFLMVRGIKAPAEDAVAAYLKPAVGERERALKLFGEGSMFSQELRDAMHQSGKWPKSLQPNVDVLQSWRSLVHMLATAEWPA